ncbi:DUF1289 domain-containing protein [Marinobacter vulgaris]|uniref:DUF1289 domain-containing protein n=1 Tax=Marinobacter vulgaris TaxID=1928331 RepID=A0A2V3ZEP0_9GAMM|nr:DUF1289 domain-containing protein [Marinobacter vulgaris]PXX88731.1 DUF1289 domain-containing protein [Marinobacter vulgaris]TSJ66403.1 DUF1289 domain-containing protein [Marinobacter vulgaris]
MSRKDRVSSPCISICALDENEVCIGCQRTGDEIMQWPRLSDDERQAVLEKVAQREEKLML